MPGEWRTHFLLANAYLQQKDFGKALRHATRATEKAKEQSAAAWLLLGRILNKCRQARGSEASLRRGSAQFPE
ncbi:MAG: hypothetical protein DMG39_08175 [Acidobacteria bacterium]|nr:MAG: hypothetical protein DMG39_08175 [Acidobacteriota bacterium]